MKIGKEFTIFDSREERRERWDQLEEMQEASVSKGSQAAAVEYLEASGYKLNSPRSREAVMWALYARCIQLEKRVIGRDDVVERLAARAALR